MAAHQLTAQMCPAIQKGMVAIIRNGKVVYADKIKPSEGFGQKDDLVLLHPDDWESLRKFAETHRLQ